MPQSATCNEKQPIRSLDNQLQRNTQYFDFPSQLKTDLAHFFFGDTPQDGIKLQMFSASQQVINGIKLWTVAHILMHFINLCQHTAENKPRDWYYYIKSHLNTFLKCYVNTMHDGNNVSINCYENSILTTSKSQKI